MENLIYTQILSSTSDYVDQNDSDYSAKSNPDYKRQKTIDNIKNNLESINWEAESQYHNTYYLGKGKYGYRQITCNNKEYVKRIQALLSSSEDETGTEVSE